MLSVAVPMWIEKLRGSSFEERALRARSCSNYIGAHGDDILYKTEGRTALAFNKLAQGVACGAYQPGGIKVFGLRFETAPCATVHDTEVFCDSCRAHG